MPLPPVNVEAPAVTGSAQEGETLTAMRRTRNGCWRSSAGGCVSSWARSLRRSWIQARLYRSSFTYDMIRLADGMTRKPA